MSTSQVIILIINTIIIVLAIWNLVLGIQDLIIKEYNKKAKKKK